MFATNEYFFRCKNSNADATQSVPKKNTHNFSHYNDGTSLPTTPCHRPTSHSSHFMTLLFRMLSNVRRSIMFNNSVFARMRDVLTQFFPLRFFIHWFFFLAFVMFISVLHAYTRDIRCAKWKQGMGGGIEGSNVSNYGSVDCNSYSFWAMGNIENETEAHILYSSFGRSTISPSVFLQSMLRSYCFASSISVIIQIIISTPHMNIYTGVS